MSRWCTRKVFRCFKALERLGDRITGAAGPVFVALAVVLISIGVFCFFEIIQPSLPYKWLTTPVCVVIVLNLFGHYYYVCTVPPGFADDPPREPNAGTGILWARKRRSAKHRALTGVRWSEDANVTRAGVSKCKRCGVMRPEVSRVPGLTMGMAWTRMLRAGCERSHHCRICNRCVLKYDHHCPNGRAGINQCVGIHNERHFVLFLIYMVVATACFVAFGWRIVLVALGWSDDPWPHLAPPVAFLLTFILSGVLCMAVTAMAGWHLYMIACGETSVESQDHEYYRKIARQRGESFVNCYDMGYLKNLQLFFNVGQDGYPYYTLLLPFRTEPYTDGRAWARRQGFEQHLGVRPGEELTDEDEE
ncbi:DHHC palmitoyltransferase-domain-containing protein [Ganoderma leucocontextum]|nr:DHHC palmitoyltransferase-domain-containing protein [Ganoderma leucocontextum]